LVLDALVGCLRGEWPEGMRQAASSNATSFSEHILPTGTRVTLQTEVFPDGESDNNVRCVAYVLLAEPDGTRTQLDANDVLLFGEEGKPTESEKGSAASAATGAWTRLVQLLRPSEARPTSPADENASQILVLENLASWIRRGWDKANQQLLSNDAPGIAETVLPSGAPVSIETDIFHVSRTEPTICCVVRVVRRDRGPKPPAMHAGTTMLFPDDY
jgi:hypothetical protein